MYLSVLQVDRLNGESLQRLFASLMNAIQIMRSSSAIIFKLTTQDHLSQFCCLPCLQHFRTLWQERPRLFALSSWTMHREDLRYPRIYQQNPDCVAVQYWHAGLPDKTHPKGAASVNQMVEKFERFLIRHLSLRVKSRKTLKRTYLKFLSSCLSFGNYHGTKAQGSHFWSIANAPPGFPIDTATGTLLLGFLANDSENLDIGVYLLECWGRHTNTSDWSLQTTL